MRASILIRTKNEARHLGATLDAVLRQTVPPHEIFVIDSGSTDGTLAIARRYPATLIEIDPAAWSYPYALNVGAGSATGDVLVCVSAHCRPVTGAWLGALTTHFNDDDVAAVWGPELRPDRPVPEPGPPLVQRPGSYSSEERMWGLSNANSALRRSLWEAFPFDESLPAAEDKQWAKTALEKGFSVIYEPGAAVFHEPHTVREAYRRNRAIMEGFERIFPELDRPQGGLAGRVAGIAWERLTGRLRERDAAGLVRDLSRVPSTVASVAGAYLRRRR